MLMLKNVRRSFGSLLAVDGLSLAIRPGEIFGLLGPNGAGKSTTVHMAAGILRPDSGTVEIAGLGTPADPAVRLRMSPLGRFHLLAGKALACFLAIVAVEAGMFLLGSALFRVKPNSWALLCLAALSAAVAFVGIMMLTSTLGKTEQAAAGAGWALMLPLSMLGGGMVPLYFMPRWMAAAGNFSPVKWAILALEGALWRGFSFREMIPPCAILIAVGVVAFGIGVRAFRTE